MKFDVIVIGAGSAGGALAARLSEKSSRSVLLLEAGADYESVKEFPPELLDTTGAASAIPGHPANWAMKGTFMEGFHVPVPRGKVIGGSSSINGMYFLRGLRRNFDEWAKMGFGAWSYDEVLPAFVRSESDKDFSGPLHGSDGPVPVRREPASRSPVFIPAFIDACRELGFPDEVDKNADTDGRGVGAVPLNIGDGMRFGTALAYVLPAKSRPNFTVQGGAQARRILIADGRAYGVEVDLKGGRVTYEATEEIVVSAGAFRSPHLLMLSGIGPADHLRELGIDVVADLPGVGANLMDHPELVGNYHLEEPHPERRGSGTIGPVLHWTAEGSDHASDMEIFPFLRTVRSMMNPMQVLRRPIQTLRAMRGTSPRAILAHARSKGAGSVILGLMQEESRGQVRLTSNAPEEHPSISYNFLDVHSDRVRFREVVRVYAALWNTRAMRKAKSSLADLSKQDMASDQAIDAWVEAHLKIAGHPASTCRMGLESDREAVVDQYGRVYGVTGLRVADTSIWPKVPSRGPNASAIMTGERIATFMS